MYLTKVELNSFINSYNVYIICYNICIVACIWLLGLVILIYCKIKLSSM